MGMVVEKYSTSSMICTQKAVLSIKKGTKNSIIIEMGLAKANTRDWFHNVLEAGWPKA